MLIGFSMPAIIEKTRNWRGYTRIAISGIGFLLYLVEVLWLFGKHTADDDSLLIFTPLVIIILVYWTLQSHISISNAVTLRRLSVCLYYFHALFIYVHNLCVPQNINKFAFVLILCFVCAAIMIKGKINNKWILP